jgi:hypothetical protein
VAIAHSIVLFSALVTLLGVPCAVTAVRRADEQARRRRAWSEHCPQETRALRELDQALRNADPCPAHAEAPSIDQIANDLRRLNRQRHTGPTRESQRWMADVQRAYDERLCLACECLGLTEHLEPLKGLDREIERVRVESELQAAGVAIRP